MEDPRSHYVVAARRHIRLDDVLAVYYGDEERATTQVSMDAAQAALDQHVAGPRNRSPRRRRIKVPVTKTTP